MGAALQGLADRCVLGARQRSIPLSELADGEAGLSGLRPCTIGDRARQNGEAADSSPVVVRWRENVTERADKLLDNRLTLFDLEDHVLGPEVDWNYEYEARKATPRTFAAGIDYRDHTVAGDAKVAWEPSRHQHLVVLARAYRLTGRRCYAEKVIQQLESWIRQCPYGQGMNWRSPLELAIRIINWVWALELIVPSKVVTSHHLDRLLPVVYRHVWDISRKYSRYSSANNHLVGEAAGVFIASSYFAGFKSADAWTKESRAILMREIARQALDDGGHCELAMGYHMFVLEFFLLAGLAARSTDCDFSREYWERLERMFEFLAAFTAGGEQTPMFGDCDDGYVLDLGGDGDRARSLLAIGATVFERSDFKAVSGDSGEPVYWLLGDAGYKAFAKIDAAGASGSIESHAFSDSGYYLLQSGERGGLNSISVTFDCGDVGFGALAAHAHADALSFTLRVCGTDVFVDPGTYDYFTYPRWRDYFRSTQAHNTIVVDGVDQSEMLGPFLWGRRARARCLHWAPSAFGGTVSGEHDGYGCLDDPVSHRRAITLDSRSSEVVVHDELSGAGTHAAAMYLHVAENCQVCGGAGNRYEIDCGRSAVVVRSQPRPRG